MFLEKNCSPGRIINLDHVACINWDKDLAVEFTMSSGNVITWRYENEDDQMEDLDIVGNLLQKSGLLISAELDQE